MAFAGVGLALAAGIGVAGLMVARRDGAAEPPPASEGGLVVQTGRDDDIRLDPAKPLRCFVAGRFVGELPLSACASRNGVATGALDVGLDPSGALAASGGATTDVTPLPPAAEAAAADRPVVVRPAEPPGDTPAPRPQGACWRYGDGGWSRLPGEVSLTACVQVLFAGQCVRPGTAVFGRWDDHTLRLVPGRVDTSSDNRSFRPLVEQAADCSIPPVG
ncbi:MAG: hypothetical protein JOZ27_00065 [Caulobacteraceae bacterium]|nr:hypothetical protein [Caulobacteraceae bacterium]